MPSKKAIPRIVYGVFAGKPMNFSFIDEKVAGSAEPHSKREIHWLRRKGIKAILSLTENPINESWLEGLAYKHVPMKDHAIPSLEQLRESVDFVLSQTEMNNPVLVHCMAGKGRTGIVLASYLCDRYGLAQDESIRRLRLKRPGSVERRQARIVEEFARSLTRSERHGAHI